MYREGERLYHTKQFLYTVPVAFIPLVSFFLSLVLAVLEEGEVGEVGVVGVEEEYSVPEGSALERMASSVPAVASTTFAPSNMYVPVFVCVYLWCVCILAHVLVFAQIHVYSVRH